MKNGKRVFNKKFIILNVCVVLAAAFCLIYVLAFGGSYSMHTLVKFSEKEKDDIKVNVTMEKEGIAEFKDYRIENDELVLDFKAVGKGETPVTITWQILPGGDAITDATHTIRVNFLGVLIDDQYGSITFNGFQVIIISIIAVLFISEIILIWSFADARKKGDFSYSMIFYGGVAIYFFILLLFTVYKLLNNVVRSFSVFLAIVSDTGMMLVLALTPVMLVLSLLLMTSNILLLRHEGKRPVNTLGIIFGIVWFGGTILIFGSSTAIMTGLIRIPTIVIDTLVYVTGYFECIFLSTVACSYLATKYLPAYDRDYIIILGCGIRGDGSLTPLLKGRVDSALRFENEQFEKTGKHACFVTSGGQGPDEVISESEAMSRYLISLGIPESRIIKEDKSTNTFENMKFSKEAIEKSGSDTAVDKIAFSTTNYHVFRGYIMSKKNLIDAKGISAKTKAYFYPNAFLREFIGLIVDKKWTVLSAIAVILLFFFGVLGK